MSQIDPPVKLRGSPFCAANSCICLTLNDDATAPNLTAQLALRGKQDKPFRQTGVLTRCGLLVDRQRGCRSAFRHHVASKSKCGGLAV